MSLFILPALLVTNTVELIRLLREYNTPADSKMLAAGVDPQIFRRLPWVHLLGIRSPITSGDRPLTLPVAISVFAILGAIISLIGIFALASGNGNNTPQQAAAIRYWTKTVFITCILLISICTYWNYRKTNRSDTALDVLAKIVPLDVIYQFGRIHLTAFAFEIEGKLRVVLAIQNLFNAPTSLHIKLAAANEIYPLDVQLQPSEATAFFIHLPLNFAHRGVASVTFTTSVTNSGGRRARFQDRTFLSNSSRSALATAALAMSGHFSVDLSDNTPGVLAFMSSHGNLSVAIPRDIEPCATSATWRRIVLWSPDSPMPPEYAASVLVRLIEENSAAPTR
ncbi:MAG: hypothetical protein FWD61_20610 [Phycisphaerales bacterium]|nr:hypothetical protein [Phycisphaerales bacterium]